jgi:hypothetical protein
MQRQALPVALKAYLLAGCTAAAEIRGDGPLLAVEADLKGRS